MKAEAGVQSKTQVHSAVSDRPLANAPQSLTIVTVKSETIPDPEEPLLLEDSATLARDWRYDPITISRYYDRRPIQAFGRLLGIFIPLLWFFLGLWWDRRRGKVRAHQQRRAIQLRETLTRLGPAFIKVGQALSTRPDLVPPLYLEELAQLQDQLPPFSNEVAYRFIEEELGGKPLEIYAKLTPEPVSAASLGQVYKGQLHTGEIVAVKVQRPGLAERITLDLYILRRLAHWGQKHLKLRSNLVAIMDEFGARIFEEMDYAHEGRNAERFAKLYGHLPGIYVPRIYWEYTRRRVLTMEWIAGTKLTKLEELSKQGINATELIEVGVQCSLQQLLEHGFFHADPHPGNLMAMPNGKLAYLDFGMMSEVKPYQRYGLIEAVVHMVNRDFERLVEDYVKLEFLDPDTDLRPIVPALANVFSDALGASVADLNFKSITDQLSELMYEYPFKVPAYYALIIRSLVTLEGIAINVDPDFKVLSKAYPYIAKRLLTDPAPELRASLRDLLFRDDGFRWNRLENLLRNARGSADYDFDQTFDQAIEFLFSERGAVIRHRITEELVQQLDAFSMRTIQTITQQWFGHPPGTQNGHHPAQTSSSLEPVQRILAILQETPGFDPLQKLPTLAGLLLRPEVQEMGQQVVLGLAQRAIARLIREILLREEVEPIASNGKGQGPMVSPVSLPSATP